MPIFTISCNRLLLLSAAAIPLWALSSIAQAPAPDATQKDSSFQLKVQSNLVLVRVVVRDAKGDPIRGLTKEDFRLFDQGKEQPIAQFDEEPGGESPADPSAAPAPGQPPTAATTSPLGPRFIALYFDELNSSDADLMQARDAAERYLATSLQPNDRVAIFTAEKILSNFTADPHQIQQALSQLHASARGPAHEHLCPDISDYQAYEILQTNDLNDDAWKVAIAEAAACPVKIIAAPSIFDSRSSMQPIRMLAERIVDQAQNLTRANLAQFEQVVKFIAQAPGQRTIVLVSPGFLSESEQYALDRIVDRALRAHVVINSLDPKGLAVLMRESNAASSTIVLADPKASEARRHLDASKEFVGADVLAEMAAGTGGVFFHNDNDLRAGFAALAGDPPHYVLAFSPKNGKWDGKFHTLKVTLATKEKGRTIQARRGYFAVQSDNVTTETAAAKTASPRSAAPAGNEAGPTHLASTEPVPIPSAAPSAVPPSPPVATEASAPIAADTKEPSESSTPDLVPTVHPSLKPLHLHRGTNHVSLDQLEQFLADTHGKSDAELAKALANFELTERVDSPTLLRLEAALPGDQSRQSLTLQADVAAFLKPRPSASNLPAVPSADDQVQWLKSASDFVANTLHKLPNFFATRAVIRFVDTPARQVGSNYFSYQPLHETDHLKATVLYRDGKQVLDANGTGAGTDTSSPGLMIAGEFGPILATVLTDASKASIGWSHWEAADIGPLAVFRFVVPRNKSHYEAAYCCVNGIGLYKAISAYHGEIAIDPATGSILRIAIQADLKESYPLTRADLVVEYRPVEIGGKAYICPVRSVAIMKAYTMSPDMTAILPQLTARDMSGSSNPLALPIQTMINDIAFKDYHLFRSDSRIVSTSE